MENTIIQNNNEKEILQDYYNKLIISLEKVPDLDIVNSTSKKISTAWLIDRIKEKNKQDWQKKVEEIIDSVDMLNKKGGELEVNYFLNQKINDEYLSFLEEKNKNQTDEGLKKKFESLMRMTKDSSAYTQEAKTRNKVTSFGGVSLDYVPKWYFDLKR